MTYYSEEQIKKIVEAAAKRLGSNPTTMEVRDIVKQVLESYDKTNISPGGYSSSDENLSIGSPGESSRVILTAFGKNHPGVIATITKVLADFHCDIQDMTQKLMQEFYSLMIIFDMAGSNAGFDTIREKLLEAGNEVGAKCLIQHEDIFQGMHRI